MRTRINPAKSIALKLAALALLASNAIVACAETPAPESVRLANDHEIEWVRPGLVDVDAARHKKSALIVPAALRRALRDASSVAFPSDHAKRIDGNDYLLVVVNRSSNSRPTGYCGAGEEGALYVLELHGSRAVPRFSLPVQSCVDSVSLDTDGGAQSPYLAIAWRDDPIGIDIRWEYLAHGGATHRVYRFVNGAFVEAEVPQSRGRAAAQ
ncbi:MAG: hypothetical protein GAK33_07733 [Burkholderia lata]|uniref:Lipoprotein n=1 Tax=Burkholderia lata (strain ATCC 17760 / DSM 23089 / LMG 22485 / NCIMB 9086 / R18194 / 383) TaxID=482957 RepID=A0A833PII3_BURL3|nr:hypothetical protein [Burkholderia lata]KAF1031077.1 MAG: hypothetical protein GAK33_07733 [Burkholderia lata]